MSGSCDHPRHRRSHSGVFVVCRSRRRDPSKQQCRRETRLCFEPPSIQGVTRSAKMVNKCRVTENKLYEQSGSLKIHSRWLKGCVSSFCGEHGFRCNSSTLFGVSTETRPSAYMANILSSCKFYNLYLSVYGHLGAATHNLYASHCPKIIYQSSFSGII